MRVFSALGTFAINYWLVGLVQDPREGDLPVIGGVEPDLRFFLVCCFVREVSVHPAVP